MNDCTGINIDDAFNIVKNELWASWNEWHKSKPKRSSSTIMLDMTETTATLSRWLHGFVGLAIEYGAFDDRLYDDEDKPGISINCTGEYCYITIHLMDDINEIANHLGIDGKIIKYEHGNTLEYPEPIYDPASYSSFKDLPHQPDWSTYIYNNWNGLDMRVTIQNNIDNTEYTFFPNRS